MNVSLGYAHFIGLSEFHNIFAAIKFFLALVQGLTVTVKLDRERLYFPVSSNITRADAFDTRWMPNSNYYIPLYLASVKQQGSLVVGIFIMSVNTFLPAASDAESVFGSIIYGLLRLENSEARQVSNRHGSGGITGAYTFLLCLNKSGANPRPV